MKTLLIISKDITESGGGERVCANLANLLSSYFEVQIVSFFRAKEKSEFQINEKIKIHFLSNKNEKSGNALTRLFNKTLYRYFLSYKTHKLLTQENPSVALSNDGWFLPLWRVKNIKYLRIWHIKAPKKKKRIFERFDSLIILSPRELRTWQSYHKNLRIIPNFLPHIPADSTNHAQKVVLSVGRMDNGDQKGFLRLVDIWELVQRKIENIESSLRESGTNEAIQNTESNFERSEDSARSAINATLSQTLKSVVGGEGESCERGRGERLRNLSPLSLSQSRINGGEAERKIESSGLPQSLTTSRNDKNTESKNENLESLKSWKLHIVGDGVLKQEIEAKIKAKNLQDSIILKPFTKEIEREYLSASIYAMASHFEGFGMVLIESAAYELPSIAFDVNTGPSDIIDDGKSGYLVSDNDLEGFADKILTLMQDENLRVQFGKRAKEIVKEGFSKDVIMQKWREILG